MKVKILKAGITTQPGEILDMPIYAAEGLIRRKRAELVPDGGREEKMVPQRGNQERMKPRR